MEGYPLYLSSITGSISLNLGEIKYEYDGHRIWKKVYPDSWWYLNKFSFELKDKNGQWQIRPVKRQEQWWTIFSTTHWKKTGSTNNDNSDCTLRKWQTWMDADESWCGYCQEPKKRYKTKRHRRVFIGVASQVFELHVTRGQWQKCCIFSLLSSTLTHEVSDGVVEQKRNNWEVT